jgi:hypothetical protein
VLFFQMKELILKICTFLSSEFYLTELLKLSIKGKIKSTNVAPSFSIFHKSLR